MRIFKVRQEKELFIFNDLVYNVRVLKTGGCLSMELFDSLKFKIVRKHIKIAFPEATDPRILGAAARLKSEELVEPVLIGNTEEVKKAAQSRGISLEGFEILDQIIILLGMKWSLPLLNVVKAKLLKNKQKNLKRCQLLWYNVNLYGCYSRNGIRSCSFYMRYSSSSLTNY